jgi:hypothetical protein
MDEVKSLILRIDLARSILDKLIDDKQDLLHPEVISASVQLDNLLNLYNEFVIHKRNHQLSLLFKYKTS